MKRNNVAAGPPLRAVFPALRGLSQNNETMIFPSYNGLSRRLPRPLNDQIGSFSRAESPGVTAFSPRSSLASGVI